MTTHREVAYALLRLVFGVIFATTGTVKFIGGLENFVGDMNQRFSGKLPAIMVMAFAYAIPFCEITAGTLIFLGLFTTIGLTISGLLLIGLTFGVTVLGDPAMMAHNLQYALINLALLGLVDLNRFSLDALFFRRQVSAGFTS